MNHRECLEEVMRICGQSSEQSRRVQKIHDLVMTSLGLTHSQRAERHTKALQRSEAYKEACQTKSKALARKELAEAVKANTGEVRERIAEKTAERYL